MEQDIRFHTALNLENHSIHNEKDIYKKNYINALYYFVQKYSSEDIYARELLKTYNDKLNNNYKINTMCHKDFENNIKKVCCIKIKGFKLFTYRYAFICDCLFINAYDHPDLAKEILDEFKILLNSRYWAKIDELYNILYNDKKVSTDFKLIKNQIDHWIKNRIFIKQPLNTVVLTATMSAGKSTLINAIIGKSIVKTQNESCTSKCYRIYNKIYEDHLVGTIGDNLSIDTKQKELMELNNVMSNDINIATFMQCSLKDPSKKCIIDTPGVNSYMDATHSNITREFLSKENYNTILYIINAENIGTDDDLEHIRYIFKNFPQNKVIFVLNKLDRFKLKEDSVSQSINMIYDQLKMIGYHDPTVVPVSAFAGQLFKRVLCGLPLNEDETDECILLVKKFSRKEFDFSTYYEESASWEGQLEHGIGIYTSLQVASCLGQSGLPSLEKLISKGDVVK